MTDLERAIEALALGKTVLFPTETVWGLGADARSAEAVRRLWAQKQRPSTKPTTVHLGPAADIEAWAIVSSEARRLAERFWPGPLTLVLPIHDHSPRHVIGDSQHVGIRVPDHPTAIALLDGFGSGVAASSANIAGLPPPTTYEQAVASLTEGYDCELLGGPPCAGLASSVLLLDAVPRLLREGQLTRLDLEEVLGRPIS